MESKTLRLWQLYCQQRELWPGWRHEKTPIAFHDEKKAVLFGHPNPPDQFREKTRAGVKYHLAEQKPVDFTANSAVDLAGVPTATIIWGDRDEEKALGLISHEAFHAFQGAQGCPMGNLFMVFKYPVSDPLVQALAETEGSLLYRVLAEGGGEEEVKAAIDARAARQALLPDDVALFEDETELGEGLATYIEIRSGGPTSSLWQEKIELLLKLNKNAWGAERLRFYYSGMAWALLCDRFAPGWQLQPWQSLAGIVAKAISHIPVLNRRHFPGLEFAGILSRQKKEGEKRKKEIERTLAQALPGTGIRVELSFQGMPVAGGWNPNTSTTFPGIGRFHRDILMYTFDTGATFKIENNALEKELCRQVVFEGPDLKIKINDEPPAIGESVGGLEISGPGCHVLLPRANISFSGHLLAAEEIKG